MIFTPCSFTQTTNFPVSDHFIVPIAPSPECSTVSFPPFVPRPIVPNHPDAAADAVPVVVDVELPARPPTVRTRLPASPPEMYVRSFL